MGLDTVELVLATEEEFQIVISNEEAEKCTTPNLLTDLVYSKLRKSVDEVCPSMHGFYVVRQAILKHIDIPREKIKLETRLDKLIHKNERNKNWKNLLHLISNGQSVHAPLARPRWVKVLMSMLIAITFLFSLIETEGGVLALIATLLVWLILSIFTLPLKKEFPPNFQVVKDLIGIIGSLDNQQWSREKVYNRAVTLVSMQTGIKEKDIFPDSHFINDLGMG